MPFLSRYQLPTHPFEEKALNPLERREDAELLVSIPEFEKLKIDQHLVAAVANGAPVFYLVKGSNKCGLSSVAKYILYRYRELRGIAASRFIVPNPAVEHNDEFSLLRRWVSRLLIQSARIELQNDPRANLLTAVQRVTEGSLAEFFSDPLRLLSEEMTGDPDHPAAGFGLLLEQVPNYKIIKEACDMFEYARSICVFTVKDYLESEKTAIQYFSQRTGDPGLTINLKPLIGEDVREVTRSRWRAVTGGDVENPFDLEGVKDAFGNKGRPTKKVMRYLDSILEYKTTFQCPGDSEWPTDRALRLPGDELGPMVEYLDRVVGDLE